MGKRRTKKQKQKAKHTFTIKWEPSSTNRKIEPDVNRQFNNEFGSKPVEAKIQKQTKSTGLIADLPSIKKNILKSLILSSLILVSEVVLYFIWNLK